MQARHAPGARCHANGHATVMGGTVQGNAVLDGLTVWHPGATIGANAQANTAFMGPGAFGAVTIAGTTQVRGDIELREGTTPHPRRVLRLRRWRDDAQSRVRGRPAPGGAGNHRTTGGLVMGRT